MNNAGITVQHPETDREVREYFELIRKIWGEESGLDALARKLLDHHPRMSLRNIYVIRYDDRMVSTVNLIPVKWSIGGTVLNIAEMGFVGTLPTYRGKGLIRSLVEEYHKDVAKGGYDLSVLEGIPYFYRQFGYDYAIPLLEETWIQLDKVPDLKSTIQIRPFKDKDVFPAMHLLNEAQKKYYVHSLRDKTVWLNQHKTSIASDPEPFAAFAVEEGGSMIAYFRIRDVKKENRLILTEITQVDELAAQAVLSFLKNYGLRQGLENLSINVSYEEPLAEYIVSLGGAQRIPAYAWQVRITDCLGIFRKLRPLLESRFAGSMYRRLTETLNFNFRSFTIQLAVRDGKIEDICRLEKPEESSIGLNPTVFVKLLLGYKSREELESAFPDMRIAVSRRPLVDVLFPKLPSYIHSSY